MVATNLFVVFSNRSAISYYSCTIYFAGNVPSASAQSEVHQPFSEEMRVEELSLWLKNHPKVGSDFETDIEILKGIHK